MTARWLLVPACALLVACSTPFSPAVLVKDSAAFPGIADLPSVERPLEVVLVHGMCTHDEDWADRASKQLAKAVESNVALAPPKTKARAAAVAGRPAVQVVEREASIQGSSLKMTALIWSPLTALLKMQLDYDTTGSPTDCASDGTRKPTRAWLNGKLKDGLLNDCLADALAYQGASRTFVQGAMVKALTSVLERVPENAQLVLVSDSLGSKISFDAMSEMLQTASPGVRAAITRFGLIFMNANQLPILGLADQDVGALVAASASSAHQPSAGEAVTSRPLPKSLSDFLTQRSKIADKSTWLVDGRPKLTVVAFTDPNDLLSYRLLPAYRRTGKDEPAVGVTFADVLVSNEQTFFGLLERPDTAHRNYLVNNDVASAIACGLPKKSPRCH